MNRLFPLFLFAAFLVSCASSPRAYRQVDAGVARGDFAGALAALDAAQEDSPPLYPPGSAVLFYLDRGVLSHYAERYAESAADLEAAEDLIRELYTKSVSQGAASYILNDNTRDYGGEDYEDMYINVFAALDYYHRGDASGALVEIRKLTEKLYYLETKYADDVERMSSYAESRVSGVSLPPTPPVVHFYNSALARWLSGIFYRGTGASDNARVDFLRLAEAWAAAPEVYRADLPASLVMAGPPGRETNEELALPPGTARLNIVAFSGLSPVKVERDVRVFFPFRYVPDAVITVPVLEVRPSLITGVEVTAVNTARADGEESYTARLYLLEDMGAVMEAAFSRKYAVTLIKTFIRTMIKYIAADAAGRIATDRSGSALTGFLSARLAKAAADISESADIRSARYLPALAWAGGLTLPPGEYSVTVRFYAGREQAGLVTCASVPVRERETNLVEAVLLR
ncbi:MAG: hypothetical protein LBC88_01555 [Spirochaetaceae bacterium]|jgi:hypothetical protein|nr:hypothetical protein [Spirochaetaceae bacterium]